MIEELCCLEFEGFAAKQVAHNQMKSLMSLAMPFQKKEWHMHTFIVHYL